MAPRGMGRSPTGKRILDNGGGRGGLGGSRLRHLDTMAINQAMTTRTSTGTSRVESILLVKIEM